MMGWWNSGGWREDAETRRRGEGRKESAPFDRLRVKPALRPRYAGSFSGHSALPRGFTIIEVLVAIFIFTIAVAGVTHMLRTAEKVRARSKRVTAATLVAANEAERIRKKARYHEAIDDSAYAKEINSIALTVHRKVVVRDAILPQGPPATQEVAITVVRGESVESTDTIASFRVLQGYEQ